MLSVADVEQRTAAVWECVQQIEDSRRQPGQQVVLLQKGWRRWQCLMVSCPRDATTAVCGTRLTRHTCSCSVVSEQSEVMLAAWSQAVWFLVSDSLTARQAAKARYGAKVVTDTQAAAVHVGCEAEAGCSGNATHKAHGMQV